MTSKVKESRTLALLLAAALTMTGGAWSAAQAQTPDNSQAGLVDGQEEIKKGKKLVALGIGDP